MLTQERATVQDLYEVPDNQKAELVDGQVVTEAEFLATLAPR